MQLIVVPVLFYVGARMSVAFAVAPEMLVMLWIPNGLLLAALLHYDFRRYPAFAAAVVAAEIAADYPTFPVVAGALFGAINLVEVTAAYWLLRRWQFDPAFARPIDLGKFLTAGPVIGALAAACAAAAVYRYFGRTGLDYLHFARVWWFSDATGLLIVTPLVLSAWPVAAPLIADRGILRWYDGTVAVAALGAAVAFLVAENATLYGFPVRPVVLMPFVFYAAARLTPRGTALVVFACSAVVLFATKRGHQPYGDLPIELTIAQVQQSLIVMAMSSLGLSALLTQLRANARQLERRVAERTSELVVANEQLQRMAVTDPLTGVANRRLAFETLRMELERGRRHARDLALILFDIDRFKDVNDRYGHEAGDLMLRHVAALATRTVRGTDLVARHGGEEFMIVAPDTGRAQALHLADRIRVALSTSEIVLNDQSLRVTASFGVAMMRPGDQEPEQVMKRADLALYAAKASGRDCVRAEAAEAATA